MVGGGLGGLTLAIALRRAGVDVVVFERTAELREVGAAVALAANSTRLLARLGLADELAAVSTVPSELAFRDGMDGRLLVSHPIGRDDAYRIRYGGPLYGLHRGQLQRILGTALGAEPLRLGCEIIGLHETSDDVVVECANGEQFAADVVVGADGVHSMVRAWITDEQPPMYTRTSGFRGLVLTRIYCITRSAPWSTSSPSARVRRRGRLALAPSMPSPAPWPPCSRVGIRLFKR